jgi:hypothetical protein
LPWWDENGRLGKAAIAFDALLRIDGLAASEGGLMGFSDDMALAGCGISRRSISIGLVTLGFWLNVGHSDDVSPAALIFV